MTVFDDSEGFGQKSGQWCSDGFGTSDQPRKEC